MGWRTDQAYEDARKAAYREWQAALTWGEYMAVLWRQWTPFVAGMATSAAMVGLIWLATR